MHRLILAGALALSACVTTNGAPGYRDTGAQMSSIAAFDPLRFSGRWYEVASAGPGCTVGALTLTVQTGGGLYITEGPCATRPPRQGVAKLAGPGRISFGGDELWVLWVDADYRTAVIGTPDGRFGYVLDRTRESSRDRFAAALDILEWNGYDLSQFTGGGT